MIKDYELHEALVGLYLNAKSRLEKKRKGVTEWELNILEDIEEKMVDQISQMLKPAGKIIQFPRKVKKPPNE